MTDEEYEEMLKRGYMTDEDWGEISREAEKAWDECEASRAKKCPECGSNLQCSVEDCYRFCSCKCGYEDFGWA